MPVQLMAAIGLWLCLELATRGAGRRCTPPSSVDAASGWGVRPTPTARREAQRGKSVDSGAGDSSLPSCTLATAAADLHITHRARQSMRARARRSTPPSTRLAHHEGSMNGSVSRRPNDPRFTSTRCRRITVANVEEWLTLGIMRPLRGHLRSGDPDAMTTG